MKLFSKKAAQPVALKPGQQAHDFRLAGTQNGEIQLSDLQGQPVILAFYPKDNTAVCSSQLALYNEILDMFDEHGAILLGISVDDLETHQAFSESLKLKFPLLSDAQPRGEVARLYGVYDQKHNLSQRALFVIDKMGIIQWRHISPPGINPGADGILNALEDLS
jgi:peroxiredoxin